VQNEGLNETIAFSSLNSQNSQSDHDDGKKFGCFRRKRFLICKKSSRKTSDVQLLLGNRDHG